ncbi:unnamed protein product [Cochlearia groenlandica]
MSSPTRELVLLIHRFLDEEKFKESLHTLEQESGIFFDLKYFEEKAMLGEWDEVEKYISGFTNVNDNRHSTKIYFEIRKQKYLEALDRKDNAKAVEILTKELKVFATHNEDMYKEITQLITLENFRENKLLSKCGDTKSVRRKAIWELRLLIEDNPLIKEKLALPTFNASHLRTLIDQSSQWQHQQCKNPQTNPEIETLLTDHTYSPQSNAGALTPGTLPVVAAVKPLRYATLGVHGGVRSQSIQPFKPSVPALNANALARRMANFTPSLPPLMHLNQVADHEKVMSGPTVDQVTYPTHCQAITSLNELPRLVARTMHQGSVVTSMDFHPSRHTFLTVGCSNGEVTLWQVGTGVKVVTEPFKIWNTATCSVSLQGSFVKDPSISVSRVSWSPDGKMFGTVFEYCQVLICIFNCTRWSNLILFSLIDAHVGSVNDLAFTLPNEQPCVVTCGDDKLIKVWDLCGKKLYTFEGHDAPVYSICPHQRENIPFIFSTGLDGKIKVWLYDNMGSRSNVDAPGQWFTTMLYSGDGSRLFSCGTNKEGDSFLVEWDANEGAIKRTYVGFIKKKSPGVVQFDTSHNRFLAVGEDNQVKFWDMDNTNLLTTVDTDGGLPSLPRLRFNKRGNLLAVTTAADGFKILANADGLGILKEAEASKGKKNGVDAMSKPLEVMEIRQCRQVTITDCKNSFKKRLWKWSTSEQNPNIKVTTSFAPQHWQPNSGGLMINDVPDNSERNIPCIALSKNDAYVISACGGTVSVFDMKILKVKVTFAQAATALTFHPYNNNVIVVGMADSTILIYDFNVDELKAMLKGHQKHITGLAFSPALNLMVSAGADAQLFFWSIDSWKKKDSLAIQLPSGTSPIGEIQVQFHNDQLHLMVSHETHIAIYDCSKMECIQKWMAQESVSSAITSAYYSCDSRVVYASFADGNIGVFDGDYLRLLFRIAPAAYIPQQPTPHLIVPMVITAHPQEQALIAVALSDGSVKVLDLPISKEVDAMSRTRNLETVEKSKPSEVMEIVDPTQCRQVTITDCKDSVKKVARILYKNSGDGILALGTNGVQRLWKWSTSEQNPNVKPKSGLLMTNDVPDNSERNIPCIALSKNDSYVISACGGKVILTNMWTFKVMATLREAPPASTFLSFHPQDSNIIGVGMEDSSIDIYTTNSDLKARLKGHRKHITGLAFSHALKLMVSAGADGQLCFWSVDSWEKKGSLAIQLPDATSTGEIRIQFHTNQLHLLVYHETEIVIYDCKKMDQKWMAQVEALSSPITSACYSCDNLLVYASFADGNIRVFDCEYLRLLCRIAPSAYIPQQPTSQPIVPMAIAAHPQEQTQIAVGLSDGSFKVLETPQILRRSGVADKAGAGAEKKIGRGGRRRRP